MKAFDAMQQSSDGSIKLRFDDAHLDAGWRRGQSSLESPCPGSVKSLESFLPGRLMPEALVEDDVIDLIE